MTCLEHRGLANDGAWADATCLSPPCEVRNRAMSGTTKVVAKSKMRLRPNEAQAESIWIFERDVST